jgi:multidrug efflux system outer membrane protein
MSLRPWTGLAAAAALLSGCAHLNEADRAPRTDPVARLRPQGPPPWHVDFGDPALADLLRDADAGSLDVKIALARVARARAEVAEAHARRTLRVSIGAEAAGGGTSFRDARSAATPTFEAAYEVDLWGRLARADDATAQERAAADADLISARLLVAAETVRAFAALRDAQAAVAAFGERVSLAERSLALTERRAGEGAAGPPAVAAARAALAPAQYGLAAAQEDVGLHTARLADLLGRPGVTLPAGPALTAEFAPAGPASEALAARPDVQAAFARLQAADARRAESVAASRPQVQIAALLGAPDASIATLLDARALAWAVAATITHSLLDGGAARARVQAASADADVADLQYRKAVLAGWSDLRAALVDAARARRALAAAQAADAEARRSAAVVAVRRREGVADGLDGIAAIDAQQEADDQLRGARLGLVEARVRLALATGGL